MTTENNRKQPGPSTYLLGFVLASAWLVFVPTAAVGQGPGIENGQWTYLGGDAWHTRYTEAAHIDASNFEDLELAWQWNAASFDPSTSRATPTYVDGKLITVTGERVGAVPIPGVSRYGMSSWIHEGKQYVIVQLQDGLVAMALP